MTLDWTGGDEHASCPVCHQPGAKPRIVSAPAILAGGLAPHTVRFLRCPECNTVFAPASDTPDYDEPLDGTEVIRYYIEHLAPIDTMVDPLFKIDRARVSQYAEVGCSFGFSLDFARHAFGWTVRGIEPGGLGLAGAAILGLPIEARYFTEAQPLAAPPADLLMISEVIEHIADPHAFMRAILLSLAPDGVLIMSTPNAEAIRPGMDDAHLNQVLCPGFHLVLYTPDSLVGLVEAHGFTHHRVQATPTGMTVYAARQPFAFDPAGATDRSSYAAYLQQRLDTAAPGSDLQRGLAYRLIREHMMYGHWTGAEAFTPRLAALYRSAGIDLLAPDLVRPEPRLPDFRAFARRHPLNLSGVFYALGMVQMLHHHDDAPALAYFDASLAWSRPLRALLQENGIDDAEGAHIEREAQTFALQCAMRLDPATTLHRLVRFEADMDGARADIAAQIRRAAFVALVTAGDLPQADRAAPAVIGDLALAPAGTLPPAEEARACYAVGIYALNRRHDRLLARPWLLRAAAVTPGAEETEITEVFRQAAREALARIPVPAVPLGTRVRRAVRDVLRRR